MTHCTGFPLPQPSLGSTSAWHWQAIEGVRRVILPWPLAQAGSPAAELLSQPCGKAQTELCNSRRTLGVAPSSSDLGVAVHFYKASVGVLFTLKHQEG